MNREDVLPIAEEIRDTLAIACQEIQVAGSVRRGKADVHDLEFVLLPTWDFDMFGEPLSTSAELDVSLHFLLGDGTLAWDREVKRAGPKLKRLIHVDSGLVVELYIADERNFGNIYTIRTRSADFTRLLVTPKDQGGGMPFGFRQIDGYLQNCGQVVPCRDEEAYFAALGVQWCEPSDRTSENARQLVQRRNGVDR